MAWKQAPGRLKIPKATHPDGRQVLTGKPGVTLDTHDLEIGQKISQMSVVVAAPDLSRDPGLLVRIAAGLITETGKVVQSNRTLASPNASDEMIAKDKTLFEKKAGTLKEALGR